MVVLAGGLATRLHPVTEKIPKAMVDIAGRPFIDYQLALWQRHGIRRIVLCLGHLGEQVADHLGDGSDREMEIRYSFDGDRLLGTGGALRRALDLLGECASGSDTAIPSWTLTTVRSSAFTRPNPGMSRGS